MMKRNRRRRRIFWLTGIVVVFFFSQRGLAVDSEVVRLGPLEVANYHPGEWRAVDDHEVNHWVSFYHQGGNAAMTIALDVVTNYEKRLGGSREIIRFFQGQWVDFLRVQGKKFKVRSAVFVQNSDDRFLVELDLQEKGEAFKTYRYYQLALSESLILIYTLDVRADADTSRIYRDFMDRARTARINPDIKFSTCVRVGMMGRQFLKFADTRQSLNDSLSIVRYLESLKEELREMMVRDFPHGRSANFLLGYLECYDQQGRFFGGGFDRKKAIGYFSEARKNYPDSQEVQCAIQVLDGSSGKGVTPI